MKTLLFRALSVAALASFALSGTAPAAGAADREKVARDFAEALAVVEERWGGELDYARAGKAAIDGMLRELDPHSIYFDPAEYEEFQNGQQSQYFGTGAIVGPRGKGTYVIAPYPGTPAAKAGVRYGDQIVAVGGESVEGWPLNKVSGALRGPRGTKVSVTYSRPGLAEPFTVELVRDAVPQPTVTNAYMIAPGVGYIHQERGWDLSSSKEVIEAMTRLKGEGMNSLVFDLRGNPGGLVREAVVLANEFLFAGQDIVELRGRPGSPVSRDFRAWNDSPNTFPLVVLVDQGSASASEILAGALQDHDRALIVGETSFGKALSQLPFELGRDGGALILTTARYYTPSGRSIQRDYSKLSSYDYHFGRGRATPGAGGPAFKTDEGRAIYGGGGITPDVTVARSTETGRKTLKWMDATFMFTREVVNGRVKGFERLAVAGVTPARALGAAEFAVTEPYYEAFKAFVAAHPELKTTAAKVDADREFVRERLRYELATAHYGLETAEQATMLSDPQVRRALAELPAALRMAEAFRYRRGSRAPQES